MGRFILGFAALLFFFAAIHVTIVPNPTAWGLTMLALGLTVGSGWTWTPWKKTS